MTPKRKVGLVCFCMFIIMIVATHFASIDADKRDAAASAKALNETPYLIKEYGNGVYLIEMNPKQRYYYEEEDSLALGLSEMRGKCSVSSKDTWMGQNGAYAIQVITSGVCEVATTSYKRLH